MGIAMGNVLLNVLFLSIDQIYLGYNASKKSKYERKMIKIYNRRIENLKVIRALNKNPDQLKYVT